MWRNNYCGVTSFGRDKCSRHLIQCTFSIPFISWKPTVWPAIDCLQIMVCSGVFCGNYYSTYEQLQPFSCMKNGRSLTWDVRDWFKYENKLCDQVITFFNSTKLQNIMFCPCLVIDITIFCSTVSTTVIVNCWQALHVSEMSKASFLYWKFLFNYDRLILCRICVWTVQFSSMDSVLSINSS